MIKSSSKNGIKVEKDIELVMKNTGTVPWYDYIFQYVILAAIGISICFCLSSGLHITVDNKAVIMVLGLMTAYFMILYSFRSVFKYSGIVTFFCYVMFGYINLERLQAGYAAVYNVFITLYNEYFNTSIRQAAVSGLAYENAEQYFLLFVMVIIVAIVCYTGMYGKTMLGYLIFTAPIVYLSFLVGYTPSSAPYLCYIIGTIALFAGTICEKYGLFSKANRANVGAFVVHTLEKARVKAQVSSFVTMLVLFGIIYFWYSPKRYEEEFDAKQIRTEVQQKIKQITSTDFLKNSIFNKLTDQFEVQSNSGMSNGRLGRIGTIKYDNSTALKVMTERTDINKTLYLKGYIGERYTGDAWKELSKADQAKLEDLNFSLQTGNNLELLYQRMLDTYMFGIYPYLPLESFSIVVENVNADSNCDYTPYNSAIKYELSNGKIQSDKTMNTTYVMYDLGEDDGSQTYYEKLFKYGKFSALLQLNVMNTKIFENAMGESIQDFCNETENDGTTNVLENLPGLPLSRVDQSATDDADQTMNIVALNDQMGQLNEAAVMSDYKEYAKDENAYFNLVKDIYTKLPENGLERVKELVKDKQVTYEGVKTDDYYETMDQVDTTSYAKALYENYVEQLGLDASIICSDDFTYDQLMNQDKMFEAISYVKDYLASNTSYTLSPGTTPSNEDFVEYFLFQSKKGYCMHYASAATVMLRAMGVPARYVEGYVVTASDFDKATLLGESTCPYYPQTGELEDRSEELVQISVKDTNAHAWVEVYLPGYGWTPIEMTAPYSDGSNIEIPAVNSDPKATLKPTKAPTATPAATTSAQQTAAPASDAPSTKAPAAQTHTSWITGIQNWYQGLNSAVRKTIQIVLILLILLVLTTLFIWARRRILCLWFARRMQSMTGSERILYAYQELVRMTRKHIPEYATNMGYEQYASRFAREYPFIRKEDASVYFSILLKAKFGMGEISREEEHLAMAFYQTFIRTMYEGMNKRKKFYYDYIFVIRE